MRRLRWASFWKRSGASPEEYWQSLAEDSQEADRRVSLVAEEDGLLVGTVGGLFGPENEVLAFAGLAPYERREQRVFRKRGAMPIAEAIVLLVQLNGRFPSNPVLHRWARDADISLGQHARTSTWWSEALDAATTRLEERGIPVPAERPKPGRPRKGADRGYVLPDHPLDYAGQDELVATHKGNTHTATALADGTLRVGDKVAASPSAAQLAAIGVTKNGWRWSRVHRNGRLAWLDDVRDELLARWTWQADHQPRSRSDDVA